MSLCISLHCSVRIVFGFVSKQEDARFFYKGYGHRPTALGVVGKIFRLAYGGRVAKRRIKSSQFPNCSLALPVLFPSYN